MRGQEASRLILTPMRADGRCRAATVTVRFSLLKPLTEAVCVSELASPAGTAPYRRGSASVYSVNGRQFVVIAGTRGRKLGGATGDASVAFAPPAMARLMKK